MPAHQVYVTLIDIWSHGCNPMLRYSLPVLFSFELSSLVLSALGIYRRSHYALLRAEAEAKASQERLESALLFEKNKRAQEKAKLAGVNSEGGGEQAVEGGIVGTEGERRADVNEAIEDEQDREDIESLMSEDADRIRKLPSVNLGPSFGFGLGKDDSIGSKKE
jgi:hypothetical protein